MSESSETGLATFIATSPGKPIPLGVAPGFSAEQRGRRFLETYGEAVGIKSSGQLSLQRVQDKDSVGQEHVRFQQMHQGIPIRGGEIIVHLRNTDVTALSAKTLSDLEIINTKPKITAAKALATAKQLIAKHLKVNDAKFSQPNLEIFNRGLFEGQETPSHLAWFIEARKIDLREFIWIDAHNGGVILYFNQIAHAKNRNVYDTNSSSTLPGTLARSEGGAATTDADVNAAYDYSGDTYDYFFNNHNRDSYDGAGAPLISTVDFCPSAQQCPYRNAFWNGSQMVYGATFSRADDVDAHEITHAVTEKSANLMYYMQSGALNESFSDIFGETVDLVNGKGTDTAGVRWLQGEDLPGIGAIRNMMTPTTFGDPGKVSDSQYQCISNPFNDSAAVHTNSGVPNHAYALMVDGGSYNGKTITGIGLTKAGKIQYRALTSYLVSSSDFQADYNALQQSCTDLIGTVGITAGDCTQVKNALDAVEMNSALSATCAKKTKLAQCSSGLAPSYLLNDDLENISANIWTSNLLASGPNHWTGCKGTPSIFCDYSLSGAASGKFFFAGSNYPVTGDSTVFMRTALTIPANARMQFTHAYNFETDSVNFYDGGVIEYTTNNGRSWIDAGPLITQGQTYNGTISTSRNNTLKGRSGFVGLSQNYGDTQLNLSSLSGQDASFRFRVATDNTIGADGWLIDDIKIYTCALPTLTISDLSLNEGSAGTTAFNFTVSLNGAVDTTVSVNYATVNDTALAGSDFTAASGTLTFSPGETSKTVTINIVGDAAVEPHEIFFVNLSTAVNATIAKNQGVGSLLNDDYVAWSANDFDADGKADVAAWNANANGWRALKSSTGFTGSLTKTIGFSDSVPVLGDFDGDTKPDIGTWQSNGNWTIFTSSSAYTSILLKNWGLRSHGDVPVPGDYDRDGKTDMAVWRAGTGEWLILQSSSGFVTSIVKNLGYQALNDRPVPGDYDSDGGTDFAIWNPNTGIWQVLKSSSNFTQLTKTRGGSGVTDDIAVPGDYDGDGATDPAIWRPGTGQWFALLSESNYLDSLARVWGSGANNDIPIPGDYDGDRKTDLAFWNPATGIWNILRSSSNYTTSFTVQLGSRAQGDVLLVDQLAILRQLNLR